VAPRFLCDEMLGGLSRWLRAAGYDASLARGEDDGAIVARAAREGRILLSSDGGIFERSVVATGQVPALLVPRATPPIEQLRFVLARSGLGLGEPRCMACGGELVEIDKASVAHAAPARSFAAFDRFWRCAGCAKLYWHGSHWERIQRVLARVTARS
jgi:uncharacterized protein with PIN domain